MNKDEIRTLLREKYDFEAPDWWECQWQRVPCQRPECALCGRIMKQRFKHQFRGEDPDCIESALQDVGDTFAETKLMLTEKAEELGIDLDPLPDEEIENPPDPDQFPIWKEVFGWSQELQRLAERERRWEWTSSGQELIWYSSLIPAKLYRILCDRWRLDKGQIEDELDYDYTRYVLVNCIKIVEASLDDIMDGAPFEPELIRMKDRLILISQAILSI